MKSVLLFLLLSPVLLSCSAKVEDHAGAAPDFDLYGFFEGRTKAWGMVQDYSGKQIRRFDVDIVGSIDEEGRLVLDEDFVYDDGERQNRVWTITKEAENRFVGRAGDVIGEAYGQVSGNALNWQYTLRVQTADGEIDLFLDDWMFRHNDTSMFNVTTMKKFGITVGRITLFFEKQDASGKQRAHAPPAGYRAWPAAMSDELRGWQVHKGSQRFPLSAEPERLYRF